MGDWIDNLNAVGYGGEGLGIGEEYPVDVYGTPEPRTGSATWRELGEAGFVREGEGPLLYHDGEYRRPRFFVLRDEDGAIVATWDEGRWWTPSESAAFMATLTNPVLRMMAEATSGVAGNRAQRRKRRKR